MSPLDDLLPPEHPLLRTPAEPVRRPDDELAADLERLHATLTAFRAERGFGRAISAPQIGIGKRLVALQLGATPFALINPRLTRRSEDTVTLWDDCLSLPDRVVRVRRHRSVDVAFEDERGRARHWCGLPADLAELVQHELDHLDGVLMTDRATGDDPVQPIAEHASLIGTVRPTPRLSPAAIERAASRIDPVFLDSPQYECEPLSEALGCRLTLKLESANPIRSFKGRGASWLLHELERRDPDNRSPLVAASAGNWGQAIAHACRAIGRPAIVFAAVNANPLKVTRMRALGADVRLVGEDFDAAKLAAEAFAGEAGHVFVADGLDPEAAEGAGTIGRELLARGDAFDAVTVSLGNGALLSGVARWIKAASPATRTIGVSASGADAMEKSWRRGHVVTPDRVDSIADGIAVRVPIPEALEDMRDVVDDVLLVDDAHIVEAMRLLYRHAGLLIEPAGAAGVAALLAHPDAFAGQRVATVLCGGNLTDDQTEKWIVG